MVANRKVNCVDQVSVFNWDGLMRTDQVQIMLMESALRQQGFFKIVIKASILGLPAKPGMRHAR